MKKRAFIAALAAGCIVLVVPGLLGQVKTQSPPSGAAKPANERPGLVTALKPDIVAVSIEFLNLRSHTGPQGEKRYSCMPRYTFKNAGGLATGTFDVVFEIQNPVTKEWYFYLTPAYQSSLAPGEIRHFGGQPVDECNWAATDERPKFRLRLDFNHAVTESNENNNDLEKQVRLMMLQSAPSAPLKKKIN
jgi:hypothetical protein